MALHGDREVESQRAEGPAETVDELGRGAGVRL